jgi:ketosteroid isomerase-like protein
MLISADRPSTCALGGWGYWSPVSAENVELIRTLTRTAGADLTGWLAFMAPEIELHLSGVFPDLAPVYWGHDGVCEFAAQFYTTWEELIADAYRFEDLGDRVLSLIHLRARGRDGIEVVLEMGHLWTFRDGLITRIDAFADPRKALEAAGLSQ